MKTVKILQIGDMQNGFLQQDGDLSIKGAHEIIGPTNNFLRHVRTDAFDFTLIVLDTHFSEEYYQSEEGKQFPIHCEYGTKDWELAVDVSNLPDKHYLTKNQFNMWGEKRFIDISFTDPKRKTAYDNLFHIIDNLHNPTRIETRDNFLKKYCLEDNSPNIEVTMIGVASDYCNRYTMEGWLSKGARVTIIQDLTKGIGKETSQVINESQYQQYENGRLKSMESTEYLRTFISI